MAKSPQETITELKDLVFTYFKRETVDPRKGLGRYVGFGLGGAVLIGVGLFFVAIGALRALQEETDTTFTGNLSWVPYVIVVVGLVLCAALAWFVGTKRKAKKEQQQLTPRQPGTPMP